MNRLKQWRGLATRYDKRAANYRAMVVIAALMLWLPKMTHQTRPSHAPCPTTPASPFDVAQWPYGNALRWIEVASDQDTTTSSVRDLYRGFAHRTASC